MAEETKPKTLGELNATAAANAPAQGVQRPSTTLELALQAHERLAALEAAFEGYLTHEGSLHPKVTSWVNKFRARLAGVIAPTAEKGGDSEPPAA